MRKIMKRIMQKYTPLFTVVTALLFTVLLCPTTDAEEGGSGHYAVGGMATLTDLVPTESGWVVQPLYLGYKGKSDFNVLPFAGLVATGVEASSDALTLGGIYTFEQTVLGAHYSVGTYIPYVWMDVSAKVTGTQNGITIFQEDTENGFGDITLIPVMMAWTSGLWQFDALLPIYAPTGDYENENLANTGLNYWTADPTVGIAYANPKNGFNCAVFAGITFNTENEDTEYQSGSVLHAEASIQQLLPLGKGFVGLGFDAFLYEQISGDSGAGAILGDFKGRTLGIGPALSYILATETGTGVIELRWLPELETENRLEGDYVWVKAAWQF